MIPLLSILLHLGQITCHSSYHECEIDAIATANEPQINMIQQDVPLTESIMQTYAPEAELIVIFDTIEGE